MMTWPDWHKRGLLCAALLAALWPVSRGVAQEQRPHHRADWPCVGRPDPTYFRTAEASGGQVFLFDPSELAESSALMIGTMKHHETIFRAAGDLNEGVHSFTMPIDSTVESALFSVSLQCLQVVEITSPSGQQVSGPGEGVEFHQFQAGRIVTIAKPQTGRWTVTVSGKGLFFLVVQAKSTLSLASVRFVERRGRPGHEGLMPLEHPPRSGVPTLLEASLSGRASDVSFSLISSTAESSRPANLAPDADATSDGETSYLGEVTLDRRNARLRVTGIDEQGLPFERVNPPLFMAELE
jgi:von Willebrand factor A domain-containing protein 7